MARNVADMLPDARDVAQRLLPARLFDRLQRSPLGKRMLRGTFWNLAGAVMSRLLTLAGAIVVARVLGNIGYGELGIVQSTVMMFGTFAAFGLDMTAAKHVAQYRDTDPARAARIIRLADRVSLVTGTAAGIVLLVAAPSLAEQTLAHPQLAPLLRLASPMLIFSAWNAAQMGVLNGFEAFRQIAGLQSVAALASLPLLVLGTWFWGLPGAIGGMVFGQALACGLYRVSIHRRAREHGITLARGLFGADTVNGSPAGEWKVLWQVSLPLALLSMMGMTVMWACSAIIVNQPGGYAEMGVYNAATQWRNAILFLPGAIGGMITPTMANLLAADDHRRARRVLFYGLGASLASGLAVAIPVALLAGPIMAAFGAEFRSAKLVLQISALTAVVVALGSITYRALLSAGSSWLIAASGVIGMAAQLALTWRARHDGAAALASAVLVGSLVQLLVQAATVIFRMSPAQVVATVASPAQSKSDTP